MQDIMTPAFPKQHQTRHPGRESAMNPRPIYDCADYKPAGKLHGMKAVITGGDSGIGRAVALHFAKEGADVAILYLSEDEDARKTQDDIRALGRACETIAADLKSDQQAALAVRQAAERLGGLNVLVNNAGVQYPQESLLDISREQLTHTFESNVFSFFHVTRAALPLLTDGASIINTASVAAFEGCADLIDYSASKGAIVSFTRALALSLISQGIRVNAVAPGPVWTPLIVSSYSSERVQSFGLDTPMGRAAQPCELAPIYVYLACRDSSNVTGQVFHVNSGKVIN